MLEIVFPEALVPRSIFVDQAAIDATAIDVDALVDLVVESCAANTVAILVFVETSGINCRRTILCLALLLAKLAFNYTGDWHLLKHIFNRNASELSPFLQTFSVLADLRLHFHLPPDTIRKPSNTQPFFVDAFDS